MQPVAVKVIPVLSDMQHPAAVAEARREIAILRACRDVNIVQFVVSGLREWRGVWCAVVGVKQGVVRGWGVDQLVVRRLWESCGWQAVVN